MRTSPADILFLTPQFPVSLDWGGGIRTWHVVDALRRHGRVRVVAMRRGEGPVPDGCDVHVEPVAFGRWHSTARGLLSLVAGRSIALGRYRSPRFARRVADLVAHTGARLVAADHLVMAEYALQAKGARRVLFAQNAEQTIWRRRTAHARRTMRWVTARELRKVEASENALCRQFDAVFFPTREDAATVLGPTASAGAATIDNGVDRAFLCPRPVAEHGTEVLLPGSFHYDANRDAVGFFVENIWPGVVARQSKAVLHVVGKGAATLQALAARAPNVRISSDVPDMAPYFAAARVMVVPLRIGGGSRLKILESMARGTPVVSTTVGAEGLDVVPGRHLEIADTPEPFADAVVELLTGRDRWRVLANGARDMVERRYTWDAVTAPIGRLFQSDGVLP